MKKIIPFLVFCLVATCNAELRTWTAVNGKEVEAPSGENYYFELIGSKVVYNNVEIGTLIEIVETKANNIYVVKELNGNEILIPKNKSFIKEFNKDKKILEVILRDVI